MKRFRYKIRKNIYPIIWSLIIICSIYLFSRFVIVVFQNNEQSDFSIKEKIAQDLCIRMVNSSSPLISYYRKEEEEANSFPINFMSDQFVLREFTSNNPTRTVMAQENASSYHDLINQNEDNPVTQDSKTQAASSAGIGFKNLAEGYLSKEYILTNGVSFNSKDFKAEGMDTDSEDDHENQLQIGYIKGDVYEEGEEGNEQSSVEALQNNKSIKYTMDQLMDINFLVRNFYIVDPSTKVTDDLFNAKKLLGEDMTMKQTNDKPQILIYHTHSQEAYKDSRKNKEKDTVVGVGSYLTDILENTYGYQVLHDKTKYDLMEGVLDRNKAYNYAENGITKILKDNPSIEVVIDLHRDGSSKRVTMINGQETAQVMLFNGLSRDENGPITYLDNPYLQDNLAFSLQMQMKSLELYPGLFYKNYLKCYRYNLHVRPKSLLIELGTDENTLQSAMNAMEPLAKILDSVLKGSKGMDIN